MKIVNKNSFSKLLTYLANSSLFPSFMLWFFTWCHGFLHFSCILSTSLMFRQTIRVSKIETCLNIFKILFNSRDIMSIYNEPPPGMCIVPDKDDMTKVSWNTLNNWLWLKSLSNNSNENDDNLFIKAYWSIKKLQTDVPIIWIIIQYM